MRYLIQITLVFTLITITACGGGGTNNSGGASSSADSVPITDPEISISPDAPTLSDTVTLSLNNNFAYPSVTWFVDAEELGAGTGIGDPFIWNTATVANGAHLIIAVIHLIDNSTIELRRQVNISSSHLIISWDVPNLGNNTFLVRVTSDYPVKTVSATLDSNLIETLTDTNWCSFYCYYKFTFSPAQAASGNHKLRITATDSSGATKLSESTILISNPPSLTVSSPIDGGIVNGSGSLTVAGTMSTDKVGGLVIKASIGAFPISVTQSNNTSFIGNLSLKGFNAGEYLITVTATDSEDRTTTVQRTVIVASSAETTYAPLDLGTVGGEILAVDSSNPNVFLYLSSDKNMSVRVKDTLTGDELILADLPIYGFHWVLDSGNAFIEGGFPAGSVGSRDCEIHCIYHWSPAGEKDNLSTPVPFAGYDRNLISHDGYVAWVNLDTFTLYNIATKTYSTISKPIGSNYLPAPKIDFSVINGNSTVYWAQEEQLSQFNFFKWTSSTNASTIISPMLTVGSIKSLNVQTDGQRMAWKELTWGQVNANEDIGNLVAGFTEGGPVTILSPTAKKFILAGGLLAWIDGDGLKASTVDGTTTISNAPNVVLEGVGAGHVVYSFQNKIYVWNSNGATSKVLIDVVPRQIRIQNNVVYFILGSNFATVYKVTL